MSILLSGTLAKLATARAAATASTSSARDSLCQSDARSRGISLGRRAQTAVAREGGRGLDILFNPRRGICSLRPPSHVLTPLGGSLVRICEPYAASAALPCRVWRRHFTRNIDPRELGSVSLLEIKRFLRQKALEYSESHACLRLKVPRHLLLRPSSGAVELDVLPPPKEWQQLDAAFAPVFVNKTTGAFVCPDMALSGDWKTLQSFLLAWHHNRAAKKGDPLQEYTKLQGLDLQLPAEEAEFWGQCSPVEALSVREFKDVMKALKLPLRELKQEHFVKFEARVTKELDQLVFPVRYVPTADPSLGPSSQPRLVGLRRVYFCANAGHAVEENLPDMSPTSPSSVPGVFPFPHGLDLAQMAAATASSSRPKGVVIVSSVMDAVALSVSGASAAVGVDMQPVALADGTSTLPPDHLPFFEDFEKVAIWFPNDTGSFDSARAFAKKLGEKRCLLMPREYSSPLIALRKRDNVSDILKYRLRPCAHEFITTFEAMREDIFLEMAHFEEVEGIKWRRFEALNDLLRGFRRGELTVFTGKTGSGKTTFMSEYSLDLCMQGVNTLWGSFEVKNVRLGKMQLKQFSAVNLEDDLDQFDPWADKFQKLSMYYLTFHGAQEIDKVLDAMGHAVYIYDIAHVIIDNMQFMMGVGGASKIDRFYMQDVMVQKFRKFATLHNVHVTLVIHPRKEDDERLTANSVFGGAKATQEADNVIILQEEEINLKIKRKFLQIVKNRFSGDLGLMPLFFNKGTLTFSKKIFQRERSLQKRRRESAPKVEELNPGVEESDRPPREVLVDAERGDDALGPKS